MHTSLIVSALSLSHSLCSLLTLSALFSQSQPQPLEPPSATPCLARHPLTTPSLARHPSHPNLSHPSHPQPLLVSLSHSLIVDLHGAHRSATDLLVLLSIGLLATDLLVLNLFVADLLLLVFFFSFSSIPLFFFFKDILWVILVGFQIL